MIASIFIQIIFINFRIHVCQDAHTLQIVHIGNVHTQLDPISIDGRKIGGLARVVSFIQSKLGEGTLVAYLGDIFDESIWFKVHGPKIAADLMNEMHIKHKILGEHELIHGEEILCDYLEKLRDSGHVCSNCKGNPGLEKYIFTYDTRNQGSFVRGIMPRRFGRNVTFISFSEEVEVISRGRQSASREQPQIVLSHGDYEFNKRLASKSKGVRIIIGGHKDTLLYSGSDLNVTLGQRPEGEYPTIVEDAEGEQVFVLHTTSHTKHVGHFRISFTPEGDVKHYEGGPVVMDERIPESSAIKTIMGKYRAKVDDLRHKKVGRAWVTLDGFNKKCNKRECNFGNLMTDAMASKMARMFGNATSWNPVGIYIMNGGRIVTGVSPKNHELRYGDLSEAITLGNILTVLLMPGKALREALEHSVSEYTTDRREFLQVSGIRVIYDYSNKVGNRVREVIVRCGDCAAVTFEPLKNEKIYKVGTVSYIAEGGDGFKMLTNMEIWKYFKHVEALDVVIEYMERLELVEPIDEERIILSNQYRGLISYGLGVHTTERVSLHVSLLYMLLSFLVQNSHLFSS